MRFTISFSTIRKLASLFCASFFCLGAVTAFSAGEALAQSSANQASVGRIPLNRAVGVSGVLREIPWLNGSEADLFNMRLYDQVRRLERIPGAMKSTRVWIARADVLDLPGDEILLQIRSPLSCGSLGCELVVMSEASGGPRVLMRTVGDTIDAPAMNQLVINQGTNRQRRWKYQDGRVQLMSK